MAYRSEDDYRAAQVAAFGPLPKLADRIDDAVGDRYPARTLWRMEEDGDIGGGEAERIICERWEGFVNYALEIEDALREADRRLHETREKLRAAELMVALKNVGRAA